MDNLNIQIQSPSGVTQESITGQYVGQFFVSKTRTGRHWMLSHKNGKLVKGYLNRKKEVVHIANCLEALGLDFGNDDILSSNRDLIMSTLRDSINEAYKL